MAPQPRVPVRIQLLIAARALTTSSAQLANAAPKAIRVKISSLASTAFRIPTIPPLYWMSCCSHSLVLRDKRLRQNALILASRSKSVRTTANAVLSKDTNALISTLIIATQTLN